jgi:hypothetical protein
MKTQYTSLPCAPSLQRGLPTSIGKFCESPLPKTTGTGKSTKSITTRQNSPPPRTASSPPLPLETALHLRAPPSHLGRYSATPLWAVRTRRDGQLFTMFGTLTLS